MISACAHWAETQATPVSQTPLHLLLQYPEFNLLHQTKLATVELPSNLHASTVMPKPSSTPWTSSDVTAETATCNEQGFGRKLHLQTCLSSDAKAIFCSLNIQ